MKRRYSVGLVLAVLVVVTLVAVPAVADLVGPTITSRTPANGAYVSGAFTVSAHLSDVDTVQNNATVTVDGTSYPVSFTYGGYWSGEGCDAVWVEDKTQADITSSIPNLTAGSHTIVITARDALGNVSTDTFQIVRISDLKFTNHTPANGSRYNAVDLVEVTVTGPSIDASSVSMTIDGASVPATYFPTSDPTVGYIRYESVLTTGTKTVVVSAKDDAGNPPASSQWSFTVDETAAGPVASSIIPAEGAVVQGAFTVSLTASDPDNVNGPASRLAVADLILQPSSVTYHGYWDGDGCNSWWVTDYTKCDLTFSVPDLAPGTHELVLTLVDHLTDTSTTKWSINRSSNYTFQSLQPAQGERVGVTSTISAVVSGPAEVDTSTVAMSLDGAPVPATWDAATRTIAYDAVLSEGTHVVSVSAADIYGHAPASRTWSFVADITPPEIRSYAPVGTVKDALRGIQVAAADVDGVDLSSIRLQLDGVFVATSSSVESTVTTTKWSGTLAEGSHEVTYTATDIAGNPVQQAWSFFVADPPRFGTSTPAPGSVVPSNQTFTIPVNDVNADLDTASLTASLDGTSVASSISLTDARNGTVTVPLSGLADGSHTVAASIADAVGNVGSTSISFVTDASPPVAGPFAPTSGSTVSNHNVLVTCWFTDSYSNMNAASARIWVDGQAVAASTEWGGTWEGDGCDAVWVEDYKKLRVFATVPLHDGAHSVTMRAADVIGNVQQTTWSFNVLEKPSVYNLSPVANSDTLETTIAVSATATDYDGIDPARVYVRYRVVNIPGVTGSWQSLTASYDASTQKVHAVFPVPTTETRYELQVTATDVLGSATSATTNVYVGTTKPTMSAGTDCVSCHPDPGSVDHPRMTECELCHPGEPNGPCDCHWVGVHDATWMTGGQFEDHGGYYTGRTCSDCHSHPVRQETMRHWSSGPLECEQCHARALTTEHANRKSAGATMTCLGCHRSTDASVTAAITAKATDCLSCHAFGGAGHEHRPSTGLDAKANEERQCGDCHDADVVTEHLKTQSSSAEAGCDSCHDPGAAREQVGDWDLTCEDVGCHEANGALPVHENYCLACHESGNPGFASPATEVDFVETPKANKSKCANCHWPARHWGHEWDGSCGSCHPGMPMSRVNLFYSDDETPYGWFHEPSSPDASAERVHALHLAGSWPDGYVEKDSNGSPVMVCADCHAPAACIACHDTPGHDTHASTDTTNHPTETRRVTKGASSKQVNTDTTYSAAESCSRKGCHRASDALPTTSMTDDRAAALSGRWYARSSSYAYANTFLESDRTGAKATFTVTGPATVDIWFRTHPACGIAGISVDGGPMVDVDTFSSDDRWQQSLYSVDLGPGDHTVSVTVTGRSASAYQMKYVFVDAIRVRSTGSDFVRFCSRCHPDKSVDHGP